MTIPVIARRTPATPSFNFLSGAFRLSEWTIPYFTTTMSLTQAATSLRLVGEFPGLERFSWKLDELFQRDVDWPRVQRQILPYLRAENQPQFFNFLTVALLPVAGSEIARAYDEQNWNPPPVEDEARLPFAVHAGGINLGYYCPWNSP